MAIKTIDARTFRKMFLAGAKRLEHNKERINLLNVFPVPDGDTGSNMTLTIMSAADAVYELKDPDLLTLSKTIASGSLRGARGNSGVILSQLFRGFTKEVSSAEVITVELFARALNRAVDTAYKAVMKPKEGTILTVAKAAATKAMEIYEKEEYIDELLAKVIEHANVALEHTPDLLPVLKQAGVVDSGGTGFMEVICGWYDVLVGNPVIDYSEAASSSEGTDGAAVTGVASTADADIKFGYCTEFIIMLNKPFAAGEEEKLKDYLLSLGDSLVCVADDDMCKIHVHTNDPGLAIQKGLTYGALTRMKIDNMREEHQERLFTKQEKASYETKEKSEPAPAAEAKEFGVIAVSAGEGLSDIFKQLGVDEVIEGGQTMNPSTDDFLNAISKINAKNIYILPNNSNIILAANQASSITEDKKVYVIPSKTIPQGITAMINFDPINSAADANFENMSASLKNVKSGSVTYAVRDTVIDDKEIKNGDIMGLGDKTILAVGSDIKDTTIELLSNLVDDDSEIISLYYGEGVSEEDAEALRSEAEAKFSSCDVELQAGNQPVYYYIVSVE